MTGMEHAIEQAAQTVGDTLAEHEAEQCSHSAPGVRRRWIQCTCDESVEYETAPAWESHRNREVARALAEAGLLAPSPRREGQAEAWDAGWTARHHYDERAGEPPTPNPYRKEADQ